MSADWLNYHHLLYFWTVAKEGSITAACKKLHLAQPTVSTQLKQLEQRIGEKLYERSGRTIVLTDVGQLVYRYADEMFSIGEELVDALQDRPTGRPQKLLIGIPDVLPKLIAFRLLEPALRLEQNIQLVCKEGPLDQLLAGLALHELDVVFSDAPAGAMVRVKAYNHELGSCGVGLFGVKSLCDRFAPGMPRSLESAPFMLPAPGTELRRSVENWLRVNDLKPRILGEIDDTALLKVFAEAGLAFVPGPLAIRKEIETQFDLQLLVELPDVQERFFAITVERRLRNPAVAAICESARVKLFTDSK